MAGERAQLSLARLERAVARLGEALAEPHDAPLAIDGTIQRFEFVFELFWKTFKHVLEEEGVQTATPREALRGAYAAGLISDEKTWLELLQARNETSHTYDDEIARRVYSTVRASFHELADALARLRERVASAEDS